MSKVTPIRPYATPDRLTLVRRAPVTPEDILAAMRLEASDGGLVLPEYLARWLDGFLATRAKAAASRRAAAERARAGKSYMLAQAIESELGQRMKPDDPDAPRFVRDNIADRIALDGDCRGLERVPDLRTIKKVLARLHSGTGLQKPVDYRGG